MAPATREDRVRFIMAEMASGKWPEPGTPRCLAHRQELAEAWSCAEATIRDYSAEASRNLRADQGEREYLRIKNAQRMRRLARKAERSINAVTKQPDIRSAIDAWDRYGRYMGIDSEEQAPKPQPPTIVIQYADSNADGAIQPAAEPDAPSPEAGSDGGDPVGPRSR
jgi:hypothetical protein